MGSGNLLVSARQSGGNLEAGPLALSSPRSSLSLSLLSLSLPFLLPWSVRLSYLIGPLSPHGLCPQFRILVLDKITEISVVGWILGVRSFHRPAPDASDDGGDEDGHAGGAAPIGLAHTNQPTGHLAVYVLTPWLSSAPSGPGDPTIPSARNLLAGCLPAGGERSCVRPPRKGPAPEPRAAAK